MGYCMQQQESLFFIKKENLEAALNAVKSLGGKETIRDCTGRHFSWVDTSEFMDAETLAEALAAWRWEARIDEDGNIADLTFTGEKLGDDQVLFNVIAPYVEEGSFICMSGKDSEQWRWYFNGKKCSEQTGSVHYEEGAV